MWNGKEGNGMEQNGFIIALVIITNHMLWLYIPGAYNGCSYYNKELNQL